METPGESPAHINITENENKGQLIDAPPPIDQTALQTGTTHGTSGATTENGGVISPESIDLDELMLAATLVEDAKHGRDINFRTDRDSVKYNIPLSSTIKRAPVSYRIYNHILMQWALYLCILVNLCLALFEKPAVYPLPYWATILIELTCHILYLLRFIHSYSFISARKFWGDTKHIMVLIMIILTLIDIICYVVWINVAPFTGAVRWSRPLRPLYLINFAEGRQIRRAFRNIRRTLPDILNVLVLFFFSVLLFALLAMKLFEKRNYRYPDGTPYFTNYWDSIWDLYVLVTTANDPDVMMPAYDKSNWFALIFMFYLIISLYIFMSILLAVIYNNYKKHLKNEVRSAVYAKRVKLSQAFDHMKVMVAGRAVITKERWRTLMNIVVPGKSDNQLNLLLHVLDESGDNCIAKREFLSASDLLNVKLTELKDRMTYQEVYFPGVYNSMASKVVRACIVHKAFRYFFDLMILVNAVFIGLGLDQAEWFFLALFTLEIVLKLYCFGGNRFFAIFWNMFDFLIIGAALIVSVVEEALGRTGEQREVLDILMVLRVLRLIKIIGSIDRFKIIITTIINIGPSMMTYGGVIFVFYYIFGIIGMELYGGLITYYGYDLNNTASNSTSQEILFCGNKLLNGSEFYRERYCSNNFNDILKSFVMLFELTVVNQWHVLTSGFVIVTHKATRIYFFMFHVINVIIILNIFTAFILEAFILEYSLSRGRFEHKIELKIKELGYALGYEPMELHPPKRGKEGLIDEDELYPSDSLGSLDDENAIPKVEGPRFHLRKRGRKKVEVLLEYMFEDELGDMIPDENVLDGQHEADVNVKQYPLTLDSVA